jgi:hypothetical protein
MARACGKCRREKYRLSVEKLEAKRLVGRPRCRWNDIKMGFKNGWEGADWTYWPGVGPVGWGGDFSHGKYKEK